MSGNLFAAIPESLNKEAFSELLRKDSLRIERIISKGHTSPESGWYDQDENEWVVVLQGEAKLSFGNGREVHLVPGSYLDIPAHTKHRVVWTDPEIETIWLAVHYG